MIKQRDCAFYYVIPVKLHLIGNWSYKEVKLPDGNWLYYKEHTYSWTPPK